MLLTLYVLVGAVGRAWYLCIFRKPIAPKGSRLPQGPAGIPFIGSLLQVPQQHSWLQFHTWAKQYGPIFRLNLAGHENYVVNTESIANDLLWQRGNIYSSREQSPAAAVLLSDGLRPLLWPSGDKHRTARKLMHMLCGPTSAATFEQTQLLESSRLIPDLIAKPKDYQDLFMRYSSGLIFRLGFGRKLSGHDDPIFRRIFAVNHTLERVASPGAYLVDSAHFLMRLPDRIAPFKRELKGLHAEELALFCGLMDDAQERIDRGVETPCWESTYLEKQDQFDLSRDQAAYVIGTLFEAGAGTTAAAMLSWCLAMVLHPLEFERLQQDIDRDVGDKRLPSFADIANLPRVRAVVRVATKRPDSNSLVG
jgi:cytochrome P450